MHSRLEQRTQPAVRTYPAAVSTFTGSIVSGVKIFGIVPDSVTDVCRELKMWMMMMQIQHY